MESAKGRLSEFLERKGVFVRFPSSQLSGAGVDEQLHCDTGWSNFSARLAGFAVACVKLEPNRVLVGRGDERGRVFLGEILVGGGERGRRGDEGAYWCSCSLVLACQVDEAKVVGTTTQNKELWGMWEGHIVPHRGGRTAVLVLSTAAAAAGGAVASGCRSLAERGRGAADRATADVGKTLPHLVSVLLVSPSPCIGFLLDLKGAWRDDEV